MSRADPSRGRKDHSLAPAHVATVRDLIPSVVKLARHLGVTSNAIYRWIKYNRLPPARMMEISRFYDVSLGEIMHLAESDAKEEKPISRKSRDTLPTCLQVQAGNMTVAQASEHLGLHPRSVQLILKNWGDQLSDLHRILVQLEAQEISVDEAAKQLNVNKANVYALRQKYGFAPAPKKKPDPKPIVARRKTAMDAALACIAGKLKLGEAQEASDMAWRTIHRTIAKISPEYSLIQLTHWPKSLREAYAHEIAEKLPQISVKLWKYCETAGIPLRKWPKYPKCPEDWRQASVKKMMVHVLLGDESVESLAAKRGADPQVLETLFTRDLVYLRTTWRDVTDAPVYTQVALAEVLLAIDDSSKSPRLRMIEKLKEEKRGG